MAYKVKSGDTVSQIAKDAGVRVQDIIAANPNLKNVNKIRVGQSLKIPKPRKGKNIGSQGPYGRTSKTEMAMMRKSGEQYTTGVRAKMKAGAETTPTPKTAKATKAAKDTSAQAMEKARKRRATDKKSSMPTPKPKPKTEIAKKKRVADRLAALAKKSRDKKDTTSKATASKKTSGGRNVARNKAKKNVLEKIMTAARESRRKGRKT